MSTRIIQADFALVEGALRPGRAVKVDTGSGRIVAVAPPETLFGPDVDDHVMLPGRVLLPGAVNTHSHAFQVLLRGRRQAPTSFHDWVDRHLYPLVDMLDEEDFETSLLLAFAEMVENGITTVGEFHYIHNGAGTYEKLGNRYSELAIAAARRVGLRIVLLRVLYDQARRPEQRRFVETAAEAAANLRSLHETYRDDPFVAVAPAPHSLHGASDEAIRTGAALAEELGTVFHIHLAEQQSDLEVSRERYGATPLRALAKLGVVDSRLVIVHGCWLDADEWRDLGDAGGGLAYIPAANLYLGDGITDLATALAAGVKVSLGCVGPGGNNQIDLLSEARLAEDLQRGRRLSMGVLVAASQEREASGAAGDAEAALLYGLATVNGGRNLGIDAGHIAAGEFADLIAVDYGDLSLQPHHGLETNAFLHNLVHAGSPRGYLTDVIVGGEFALRDRKLARIETDEIRERLRRFERKTKA